MKTTKTIIVIMLLCSVLSSVAFALDDIDFGVVEDCYAREDATTTNSNGTKFIYTWQR